MDAPIRRDADLLADLLRLCAADAVDIGQPDRHPFLIRNVDASNSRHLRNSFDSRRKRRALPPVKSLIIRIVTGASTLPPANTRGGAPPRPPRPACPPRLARRP